MDKRTSVFPNPSPENESHSSSSASEKSESDNEVVENRLHSTEWCNCRHCSVYHLVKAQNGRTPSCRNMVPRNYAEPRTEAESPAHRGRKSKAAAQTTSKRGRSKTPAKKGKAAAEEEAEEEEEVSEADVSKEPELVEEPVTKGRGRSRGRSKPEESPKPAVTPSPTSRGRRGKTVKEPTPSPAKTSPSPRRGRGRRSDVEAKTVEPTMDEAEVVPAEIKEAAPAEKESIADETPAVIEPEKVSSPEPTPVGDSEPVKPEPVALQPEPVKPEPVALQSELVEPEPVEPVPVLKSEPVPVPTVVEPQPTQPEPVPQQEAVKPKQSPISLAKTESIPAPLVEPISPESDHGVADSAPVIEDISLMETEPSVAIPAVSAEPDQTPSGGSKRKSREDDKDDDIVESSAKRYCVSTDEQSNEAVPTQTADVEMSEEPLKKTEAQIQPSQSEPAAHPPQSTAQTSEAEAKPDIEDDFEIISHGDVPSSDSQEVQQSLPVHRQTEPEDSQVESSIITDTSSVVRPTAPEVSTSEAVCNQAEVAPSLPVIQASFEGAVSSQMDENLFQRSHNPMVEDVSPVESSMDSNIGSYGDDRDAIAPQASAADSNVSSQGMETNDSINPELVADSNANEAIPHQTNSYNYQPVSQSLISQSEPVTSSGTSNGVSHIEKSNTQIKTIEPKIAPNSAFLTKYSSDIFHRHFLTNPALSAPVDSKRQFSIVSYNILADCHMRRADYSYTNNEFLDQNYRHKLLMQELQYLDADIICFQEVNPEYYNSTLKPELEGLGYKGDVTKRCQDLYDEGEATFFKTNRFSLVEQKGYKLKELAEPEILAGGLNDDVQTAVRQYLDRPDVLHLTKLQCINTGKHITIGNIHVLWDHFQSPDVQCIQIASAIKEIVTKAGNDTSPFILCGDFNSEITSSCYQLAKDGYLSDSNIQILQSLEQLETTEGSKSCKLYTECLPTSSFKFNKCIIQSSDVKRRWKIFTAKSLVNHLWRAFQHTASNLKSAYNTVQGQEPAVTSFTVNMQTTVDYMFYNANSIDVSGCLQVVHPDVIDKTGGLPSKHFPSDHVSLKSLFNFKE